MKKRFIIFSVVAVLLLTFVIWMIWGNTAITVTEFTVYSEELPDAFSGFRIAQVSDLHNDELGEGNSRLLSTLEESRPNIIVLTGDLVDRNRTNIDVAVSFVEQAVKIAPTYYISGNHEAALPEDEYAEMKERLASVGAILLEDESVTIERGGEFIHLVGLNDQNFGHIPSNDELTEFMGKDEKFSLLLAHRPTDFPQYANCGFDLVFSGHLHGGQFRLPFIGGLYAPSYGFFPEYDGGIYEREDSVLIVSRGVGNSSFPIRFNNPREIVVVELVKGEN